MIGTTDPELDRIVLDLDKNLTKANLADDKKYLNSQYFFSNMTLARFNPPISKDFKKQVNNISSQLKFKPYTVDSVSLITGNAVLNQLKIIKTWKLKNG